MFCCRDTFANLDAGDGGPRAQQTSHPLFLTTSPYTTKYPAGTETIDQRHSKAFIQGEEHYFDLLWVLEASHGAQSGKGILLSGLGGQRWTCAWHWHKSLLLSLN